ncbi:MAG: DMT family transporter [Thermomicrobiales bacterium]
MRMKDMVMLLLLAALWGGSFLFMRIAVPVFGPVVLAELRVGFAGIALLLYAAAITALPAFRAHGKKYLILGALNAAIPYTLIAAAELHLTASLASILNATTPLFTAIVAAVWLRDRLDMKKSIGLILGIAGVAILVGWSPLPLNATIVLSVGASFAAALSYALAGMFSKVAFVGMPPLALAIAVVALALLSTSLAYLLYFSLIASVGPMKTLSVTYLIPAFGIIWSALFLHERLRPGTLIGLAIILASVALVTGVRVGSVRRKPLSAPVVTDTVT